MISQTDIERGFTILAADYHRNGVSGEGFYVGLIGEADESRKLVVFFPEYGDDGETLERWQTRIAVLDPDKFSTSNNVYMFPTDNEDGGNAWRGDHYGPAARAIMQAVEERYR